MPAPTNIVLKIHCRNCGHEKEVTDEWMRELKQNHDFDVLHDLVHLFKCKNGCKKRYIEIRPSVPNLNIRR